MKRNILTLALCFIMVVISIATSFSARANENPCIMVDGLCYSIERDETKAIVVSNVEFLNDTNSYEGEIVIPPSIEYNGKEIVVDGIFAHAFSDCPNLKSVFIPETVTVADNCSFLCLDLDSVSIPSTTIKCPGMFFSSRVRRMILRPSNQWPTVDLTKWFLRGGGNVVDTIDVLPCNAVHIYDCLGIINMVHFRHMDEVWPGEYVFSNEKDPVYPRYIVLDDEAPPTAMGEYAEVTTIGRTLLFVPDEVVESYKEASFWKTAKAIYPQSKLPEVEQLLSGGIEKVEDVKEVELAWDIEGKVLTLKPGDNQTYTIYDTQGQRIKRVSGHVSLTLPTGVYIIRCGSRAEKIIMR